MPYSGTPEEIKEKHRNNYLKHREKKLEQQRLYREKNKEKIKQHNKKYREKHKEKARVYHKEWAIKNKDKLKNYDQTEKCKKSRRISKWKHRRIIFHDWDLLYEIYLQTTNCDECKCLLNQCEKSRKCLDHDHSITDDNNVRNILCNSCNVKIK